MYQYIQQHSADFELILITYFGCGNNVMHSDKSCRSYRKVFPEFWSLYLNWKITKYSYNGYVVMYAMYVCAPITKLIVIMLTGNTRIDQNSTATTNLRRSKLRLEYTCLSSRRAKILKTSLSELRVREVEYISGLTIWNCSYLHILSLKVFNTLHAAVINFKVQKSDFFKLFS